MTWRADFSGPVFPSACGIPAFLKYLLTMMSVASCDQVSGTSASFISKTTEPSGLVILLDRVTHFTEAKGSEPALVNFLLIFMRPSVLARHRRPPLPHNGISPRTGIRPYVRFQPTRNGTPPASFTSSPVTGQYNVDFDPSCLINSFEANSTTGQASCGSLGASGWHPPGSFL